MTIFGRDLLVSLRVTQFEQFKEIIKIVRVHSGTSIGGISSALKSGDPIYTKTLVKTEFYDGWKNVYDFVTDLKSINVSFVISVNGEDVDSQFLEDLKARVTNIKREDIY